MLGVHIAQLLTWVMKHQSGLWYSPIHVINPCILPCDQSLCCSLPSLLLCSRFCEICQKLCNLEIDLSSIVRFLSYTYITCKSVVCLVLPQLFWKLFATLTNEFWSWNYILRSWTVLLNFPESTTVHTFPFSFPYFQTSKCNEFFFMFLFC